MLLFAIKFCPLSDNKKSINSQNSKLKLYSSLTNSRTASSSCSFLLTNLFSKKSYSFCTLSFISSFSLVSVCVWERNKFHDGAFVLKFEDEVCAGTCKLPNKLVCCYG